MATTTAPPAALNAAAARISSMGYGDIYGASDGTGPSSAVAGSVGYVDAISVAQQAAQPNSPAGPGGHQTGLAGMVELGHELIDSPAGLAFLIAGAVLLILWRELA
jgi:hypothetical protein